MRWLVAKDAEKALLSRQMCQELNIVKMNTKPFLCTSNNVEVKSMSHLTSDKEVHNNGDSQKKMNTQFHLGMDQSSTGLHQNTQTFFVVVCEIWRENLPQLTSHQMQFQFPWELFATLMKLTMNL
jgi:hypothetical protein